jgi:hypothetical protein
MARRTFPPLTCPIADAEQHFVTMVRPGGPGDGKLQVGDRIITIKDMPAAELTHEVLTREAMRSLNLSLVVSRSGKQLTRTQSGRFNVSSLDPASKSGPRKLVRNQPSLGRAAKRPIPEEEDNVTVSTTPLRTSGTRSVAWDGEPAEEGAVAIDPDVLLLPIERGPNGFGFSFVGASEGDTSAHGVFVSAVLADPARKAGLKVGHELLAVHFRDDRRVPVVSTTQLTGVLKSVREPITLVVKKNKAGMAQVLGHQLPKKKGLFSCFQRKQK